MHCIFHMEKCYNFVNSPLTLLRTINVFFICAPLSISVIFKIIIINIIIFL